MVHLNGSALPSFGISRDHLGLPPSAKLDPQADQSYSNERASSPAQRSARSHHAARGPKPLLPRSLKEALQLAELLSKSKLIPKGFETPETCLVGILYGMEVGLSPIAALQRMAVIDGRPTIWGDAALALVQASGLLQSIKEDVIEDQNSENIKTLTAICTVRREGRSEPITGSFSIEDAKRAGLWQKPGPWTDYPKRMLIMRARAFALRDAFPDVLAGLYLREEFVGKERQAAKQEQDRSDDDAEWHSPDVQPDFGKTNPKTSNSVNDISLWDFEFGSEAAQSKGPSLVGDTQNEAHLPLRPQPQIPDRRRAPPPPPPENSHQAELAKPESKVQLKSVGSVGEPQIKVTSAIEEQSYSTAEDHLDPETLFDLFDSALCCALDLPTLEEIVDDFAERLKSLPKDNQRWAQKIIDRHHCRVEGLDHTRQLQVEDIRSYVSQPNAKLPRGLKSLLPSLGIGRKPSTRRIDARGNRLSRSLASWNARQPLIQSNVKIEDGEEVPAPDHTPEVSE